MPAIQREETLPEELQNQIVLSEEFFGEIMNHPIPKDMEASKALACSPAALDLFAWLSYRCFMREAATACRCLGRAAW